jgi:hypothetical protein
MAVFQLADAFGRTDHVREADAELLVHNHHLTVSDQRAVHEDLQVLTGCTLSSTTEPGSIAAGCESAGACVQPPATA